MFSIKCEEQIEKSFQYIMERLGKLTDGINHHLKEVTEDEKILMKYLYGTMPLSDAVNYSFDNFLDYARHGVYLWKNGAYSQKITEDIFLNYVVYHRINEEDISPCRSFFHTQLAEKIEGKSMEDAIIEVNYWCAQEATYQTTDDRTVSPMTVYRSAFGRCGEESTFTTSVLRSVGIPARQVYAPKWSHCDDNHAWVEVWCDGNWHFIGACEPEEILDKGWFTNASSRAMLIHSRWFDQTESNEDVVEKDGIVTVLNQLNRYAKTKQLSVTVVDEDGNPIQGAVVDFEILNYSEFYPIASIITDKNGQAGMVTGLGSCNLHVRKDGIFSELLVNTRDISVCRIILSESPMKQELSWSEFDVIAPKDTRINTNQPTSEQKVIGERRFKEAVSQRKQKASLFYDGTHAEGLIKQYGEEADEVLKESRGNFGEICKFLRSGDAAKWKVKLLLALTKKDYRDCKSDVLAEHLDASLEYEETVPEEILVSYIMNPRIHIEPLTSYRKEILDSFTREEQEGFKEDPARIWDYIDKHIKEDSSLEFSSLTTSPVGCLQLGAGNLLSKKSLFVAVCRTLGIPARLNAADLSMEYYQNQSFHPVIKAAEKSCVLKITSHASSADITWVYFQNWSLAVLKDGKYQSLNLGELEWNNGMSVCVEPGRYRILTSNRLPNGNIFAKSCEVSLAAGEQKEAALSLREAKLSDMLENIEINDFTLYTKEGESVLASAVAEGKKNLFIWLEESKEPTEHILNELFERKEEFGKIDGQINFIIHDEKALKDPTLAKTLNVLDKVKIYYDTFTENVNTIGRRMYVDPDKLPLIVVTNPGLNGVYATSGYNVGTGDMLLRILQ